MRRTLFDGAAASPQKGKNMMAVCSFVGYEEVFDADIESRLQLAVDQVVENHESVEFLIYPRGEFYCICLLAALRARTHWPQKVTITLVVFGDSEHVNIPGCVIDKTIELHFEPPKKNGAALLHKKLLQWLVQNATHLITYVYDQLYDPDNRLPQKPPMPEIISVTAPETAAAILEAVPLLKEREQIAFQKTQEGCSLKETGQALGVSPERARQLLDLGSRTIRKYLRRRFRQTLAPEQQRGKRTCGLFALGKAAQESLNRFKSVFGFLVSTYDVGSVYVEQGCAQSEFIAVLYTFYQKLSVTAMTSGKPPLEDDDGLDDLEKLLHSPCHAVGCVSWTDPKSMANSFEVIADMIERTDFCICDLSAASQTQKIRQYAAYAKQTILLDIGGAAPVLDGRQG